jgi:hypothetical protein
VSHNVEITRPFIVGVHQWNIVLTMFSLPEKNVRGARSRIVDYVKYYGESSLFAILAVNV